MRWTPHSRRRLRMKSATNSAIAPSLRFYRRPLAAQAPQLENVRPVVVPGGVEALPFFVQALWVELRIEDAFLVPERAGEIRAVRAKDRRAAAADQLVSFGELHVGGVARGALVDAAREDERA